MPLFVFGVNHRTAPVEIREKLAVTADNLTQTLASLTADNAVDEAMILSTCNRTEIYCHQQTTPEQEGSPALDQISHWWREQNNLDEKNLQPYLFSLQETEAVRHLLRVASGLDSMVLGENQILGQLKDAYQNAVDTGTVGKILNKLLQHSFSVAKQVRTDTAIGSSPVSVAFAAVKLAQQVFGDLDKKTALLIGAGDTIELAAEHLHENKLGRMIVANRTLQRAENLASRFTGQAILLKDLPDHLAEADIIVSSTASQLPILGKGAVERVLKQRKHKPFFMVDIAVPRDIEPEISMLEDVYLYTVDDLQNVIEENQRSRQNAAMQADEIVLTETRHFMDWIKSLETVSTIQALRNNFEDVQQDLVSKAKNRLDKGEDPHQVIEALARTLTQKFTHGPSVNLRKVNPERQDELISAVKDLFDL